MRPRVLIMRLFKRSSRRHVDHDQDVVDEAARVATVITGVLNGLAMESKRFCWPPGVAIPRVPALSRARCGGSVPAVAARCANTAFPKSVCVNNSMCFAVVLPSYKRTSALHGC